MNALGQRDVHPQQAASEAPTHGLVPMCGHVANNLDQILTRLENLADQLSPDPREARACPSDNQGVVAVVAWSGELSARCLSILDRIEAVGGFSPLSQPLTRPKADGRAAHPVATRG